MIFIVIVDGGRVLLMPLQRLILIDDNKERSQQFESVLRFLGYEVSIVGGSGYRAVLKDIDHVRGVFVGFGCDKQALLINEIVEQTTLPIVLLLEKGGLSKVSSAIQKTVTDYCEWPTVSSVFLDKLDKLPTLNQGVSAIQPKRTENNGLAGMSQGIKSIRLLIDQVANSSATVLILGESGTGKEVVAQALHRTSSRRNKPFVPINCGAIPTELLESELFGHEKGAFTGALTTRQGRFEMAEGGTLFLDEIGDMPMSMQVKLLRVLQERAFERVGSNKTIKCDIRIIAATHRNLNDEISANRFRQDLFYRLNVFPIELPALRDRVEDIPVIATHLVEKMKQSGQGSVFFTKEAFAQMMQHPWPGNIRELGNFIERIMITYPNSLIDASDLPDKFRAYKVPSDVVINKINTDVPMIDDSAQQTIPPKKLVSDLPKQGLDLKEYLSNLELGLIRQALNECNGVVAHAAKLLNMRRTTLVEKLRKYELSASA